MKSCHHLAVCQELLLVWEEGPRPEFCIEMTIVVWSTPHHFHVTAPPFPPSKKMLYNIGFFHNRKIILDNQRCPDVHKRLLLKGFIPFCLCPCFNLCDLGVFKMWLLYWRSQNWASWNCKEIKSCLRIFRRLPRKLPLEMHEGEAPGISCEGLDNII